MKLLEIIYLYHSHCTSEFCQDFLLGLRDLADPSVPFVGGDRVSAILEALEPLVGVLDPELPDYEVLCDMKESLRREVGNPGTKVYLVLQEGWGGTGEPWVCVLSRFQAEHIAKEHSDGGTRLFVKAFTLGQVIEPD